MGRKILAQQQQQDISVLKIGAVGALGCRGVPWGGGGGGGSGTPRPKTISARDSSAQIDFYTGTPRPGTPRPSYKNTLFVAYNGNKCIFSVFYFNIRFSTIG